MPRKRVERRLDPAVGGSRARVARMLLIRKSDGAMRLAPAPSGVVAPLRSETHP